MAYVFNLCVYLNWLMYLAYVFGLSIKLSIDLSFGLSIGLSKGWIEGGILLRLIQKRKALWSMVSSCRKVLSKGLIK